MGEKNSNDISSESAQQIHPQLSMHTPGGGGGGVEGCVCVSLPKLFKELCNLKFLIFASFFSFSLTWDHTMRVKFQITSPLKVRIRFTLQNSCILLGWVSTKIVKRIVKFKILGFWPVFVLLLAV